MWRDALLVAGKDLRIEVRSRVALWQVLPFAVLVLLLAAFALGPSTRVLHSAAPGIFWLAVLFSTVLATQRSFAIESGEGTRDGLRLSGIDPAGIFLGKAAAVAVQLAVLQVVLWAGLTLLFGAPLRAAWLAVVASLLATIGLAAAGVLYGALSAGLRVRETLLPLLVLPSLRRCWWPAPRPPPARPSWRRCWWPAPGRSPARSRCRAPPSAPACRGCASSVPSPRSTWWWA